MMDSDLLAIERTLLIGISGELDRRDGTGLFGYDGPQVAIVAGDGESQKGFQSAGIEVGKEDSAGVRGQARGGGAAAGGDVEQELRGIGRGGHVDGRVVDDGAQLDAAEVVGRGESLGLRERVVETLHGDADQRSRVVTCGAGGETKTGRADGLAVLADGEAAALGAGGWNQSDQGGEKRGKKEKLQFTHGFLHHS